MRSTDGNKKAADEAASLQSDYGTERRKFTVDAAAPQFASRRAFIVWALSCGFVKPERLTESVLADLEREVTV